MARTASPAQDPADTEFADLARRLGERVRTYRAGRGMSRKVLSEQSGISERYLAQLEAGAANVSINILWSLARTMNISAAALIESVEGDTSDAARVRRLIERLSPEDQGAALALLSRRFGGSRAPNGKVALIGLRGAGKTTLGAAAAAHYDAPFVRVTSNVEQMAGMDLAEIFLTMGQQGYRRLEYNALRAALDADRPVMIETGGSLVSEPATFDLLLSSCFTVWVTASPHEHMQRVKAQGDTRPMEDSRQAMEDLNSILEARRALYARADAVIDTSSRSVDDCTRELIALCAPHLAAQGVRSKARA